MSVVDQLSMGAREKGIWVPTGARATIFVTGGKQQENTKKQEAKQTSKKKRKQRQKKVQPKANYRDITYN